MRFHSWQSLVQHIILYLYKACPIPVAAGPIIQVQLAQIDTNAIITDNNDIHDDTVVQLPLLNDLPLAAPIVPPQYELGKFQRTLPYSETRWMIMHYSTPSIQMEFQSLV